MHKKTLLLRISANNPDMEKIQEAADIIKKGGIVAFPTETVYGLGADALNPQAVTRVFEAKKRPFDNPPIVHVARQNDLYKLVEKVPRTAKVLMDRFWPGPLTLVLRRSQIIPEVTVAGLDTVAVRMPKNAIALALIERSECPIAAPSANLSGKPSPTNTKHVLDDLEGRIDAVLDGGPTQVGLESTVVDLSRSPPQVLRPGGIPYESLKPILRNLVLSRSATADKPITARKVRSPGMKHKHYAPNAQVIVVEGSLQPVIGKIRELIRLNVEDGKKVGVLATEETRRSYAGAIVKSLGSRFDPEALAKNLFGVLREFDASEVDVIVAEGLPTDGLGLAIMNRLRRASGYKIIRTRD
jgi:L-threonylcarbamoyladenylate synthase